MASKQARQHRCIWVTLGTSSLQPRHPPSSPQRTDSPPQTVAAGARHKTRDQSRW
eukprot:CAMPEP_0173431282 /NCGR_PEP_ID=MMETSP1357-20121228/9474_1 /TAXON_ID=77926 /ORGANISM="Hemiselmis rufescens, Strain PCC563" /LENGTH=54 /DNA_ID=CAMNT_0014395739 /DNA_START=149 /DNA_END=310 /DNA_ORIENTATION=-